MATYKKIQSYIKREYGCSVKSCWIAHMKSICGLPVRKAYNRQDPNKRVYPCPESKKIIILNAFKYFKMV